MEQRFTFDNVASLYDAARPGYPASLFDDVIAEAGLASGERVLEVGSGTGKATEGFARRGLPVLALEPGAQMIAVAKQALAAFAKVQFVQTTFEAWTSTERDFGLIAAAQSWHWIDPSSAFRQAARMLKPHGLLAVFGNVPVGVPAPLEDALRRIFAQRLPGAPPTISGAMAHYLPSGPFASSFDASRLFEPVLHRQYAWRWPHTTESFIAHQRTLSGFLVMPSDLREAILSDAAGAIDAYGGAFEMDYETHLYMAHRRDDPANYVASSMSSGI